MAMRLYRESSLREQADKAIIEMLDLWKSLTQEKIEEPIEVMIGNRKDNPNLSSYSGELYTAYPVVVHGQVVLALWMDSLSNVSPILVTHELGHWVIKLQGFHAFSYKPEPHSNMEILLNSLAQHLPLYDLQRSHGHEPQPEIDSRASNNIEVFSRNKEKNDGNLWKENALLVADDLLNCSEKYCQGLKTFIDDKHPNTSRLVKRILNIAKTKNLLTPSQNAKFSKRVIHALKLGKRSDWHEMDEVNALKSMVKRQS